MPVTFDHREETVYVPAPLPSRQHRAAGVYHRPCPFEADRAYVEGWSVDGTCPLSMTVLAAELPAVLEMCRAYLKQRDRRHGLRVV